MTDPVAALVTGISARIEGGPGRPLAGLPVDLPRPRAMQTRGTPGFGRLGLEIYGPLSGS
jgi:hypothetical protein